jgi:hypothetical protein
MIHCTELFTSLFLYVVLGISFFGWGKAVVSAVRSFAPAPQGTGDKQGRGMPATFSIWMGWAAALLIFQLLHLFFSLNARTVAPVFVAGLVLAGVHYVRSCRRGHVPAWPLKSMSTVGFAALVALTGAWVALRSMLPPGNYDSGLYHFNAVRWINEFSIIPGLGNLHGRLAFNQSFFAYVAALNLYPVFGHGPSMANSFLWVLALSTLLECVIHAATTTRRGAVSLSVAAFVSRQALEWLPALFGLPILAYWALSSNGLSSPSPDLTSNILQLIIFVVFAQTLVEFRHASYSGNDRAFAEPPTDPVCGCGCQLPVSRVDTQAVTGMAAEDGIGMQSVAAPVTAWDGAENVMVRVKERLFVLSLLTTTAVTIKLSNLVYCGTVMVMILAIGAGCWRAALWRELLKDVAKILMPGVLVILVWCMRGFILSGTPLYPSTVGYVQTEWAIPIDNIIAEAKWAYSWARDKHADPGIVLSNWNWLGAWCHKMSGEFTDVVYPGRMFLMAVGLAGAFAGGGWWFSKRRRQSVVAPCNAHAEWEHDVLRVAVPENARLHANQDACQFVSFQQAHGGLGLENKGEWRSWLLPLPLLAGLVFWFFTAPDIRFANATFLLLPVSAMALLADQARKFVGRTGFIVLICYLIVVGNLNLLYWAYLQRATISDVSFSGWCDGQSVPLQQKVTYSGLRVWVPVTGDQCWDAPLPCSPYLNEHLRLRRPDDLSSGFTVSSSSAKREDSSK